MKCKKNCECLNCLGKEFLDKMPQEYPESPPIKDTDPRPKCDVIDFYTYKYTRVIKKVG